MFECALLESKSAWRRFWLVTVPLLFVAFVLGGITYGFVAVFHWVFLLCVEARQRHVAQSEHGSVSASRPHLH